MNTPIKLSQYFTLDELTASQYASRHGIDNRPDPAELANLRELAYRLDEVRKLLLRPVLISSGFRCKRVNDAVGSNDRSDHLRGLAADFTCPAFGTVRDVFKKIKDSGINFDQLILEHPESNGWVHIGLGHRMRRELLVYHGKSYSPYKELA